MIHLKNQAEIKIMQEGGIILRKTVDALLPTIKPGITTELIDRNAEELIQKQGASSSFKRVSGYRWTTCLPINEQIVHTIPSKRILKNGDVLTIDIGVYHKGFHTDYATTIIVGSTRNEKVIQFLKTGETALKKAIQEVKINAYLGTISQTIEKEVKQNGFFIHKELTGHGIGRELHEDPFVPGYLDRPLEKTLVMKSGLALAIEVIYSMGTEKIAYEKGDNWSITTADGSISACFEKTVALTDNSTLILT